MSLCSFSKNFWKATIEDLQCCSFVKMTGVKTSEKQGEVRYYSCNRCGMYRPSGKGMRLTKSQGKFISARTKKLKLVTVNSNLKLLGFLWVQVYVIFSI